MRTVLSLAAVLSAAPIPWAIAAFDVAESYDLAPPPSIPEQPPQSGRRATVAPPRRPAIALAHGFGDGVPLAFALRQIVPAGTRVTLADGVDPDTPVDWRGGQAWNRALAEAAAPLGLRLIAIRGGWILQP